LARPTKRQRLTYENNLQSLTSVDNDVNYLMIAYLDVPSYIALRQTCRYFAGLLEMSLENARYLLLPLSTLGANMIFWVHPETEAEISISTLSPADHSSYLAELVRKFENFSLRQSDVEMFRLLASLLHVNLDGPASFPNLALGQIYYAGFPHLLNNFIRSSQTALCRSKGHLKYICKCCLRQFCLNKAILRQDPEVAKCFQCRKQGVVLSKKRTPRSAILATSPVLHVSFEVSNVHVVNTLNVKNAVGRKICKLS